MFKAPFIRLKLGKLALVNPLYAIYISPEDESVPKDKEFRLVLPEIEIFPITLFKAGKLKLVSPFPVTSIVFAFKRDPAVIVLSALFDTILKF